MKTFTQKIGDREVTVTVVRLPLQPNRPYEQVITATCGEHKITHRMTHDPSNFKAEDVRKEIDRVVQEKAAEVAKMADVAAFLDEYHEEEAPKPE